MIISQAVYQQMSAVRIIEFINGFDFLDSVLGQRPLEKTMVLMDVNMLRMSGLEVIHAI